MSDIHKFFESDENCGEYYSPTPPPTKLIDKQKTGLGQEARTGTIVDLDEIPIKCPNCNKELIIVKVVRPKAKIKSNIIANCCYCGDKSFRKEVLGGFILGQNDEVSIVDSPMETSSNSEYFIQNITINTKKRRK